VRNLLATVPRHAQPMVASLVRTIFAQERPQDAWAQLERVTQQLQQGKFGAAAGLLTDAAHDILAYTAFPKDSWKKIWSNNPQERLNREIRAAPMSWGSSPTVRRSSAWSARCSASSTTSGRSPAVT
jgi:putative transposase